MWAWLVWLWNNRSRVYILIRDYFWTIYNIARNFWKWLRQEANKALEQAKKFASDLLGLAQAGIASLWKFITQTIPRWIQDGIATARQWIEDVKGLISERVAELRQKIKDFLETARIFAKLLIDQAKAGILERISEVRLKLEKLRADFLILRTKAGAILDLLTPVRVSKLLTTLDNLYDTLLAFVSNPVGFILGAILPDFLGFLGYAFALGLHPQSVYDLPPPGWGKDGGRPPPADQKLTAPLRRLWVSGHRYSPVHRGIDLGAAEGDPVFAMHSGTVLVAGWSPVGYGNQVVIQGDQWWSRYAHLSSIAVTTGQAVRAGDILGGAGCTGNSTCNHLHLEIKHHGRFIDPATVLPLGG